MTIRPIELNGILQRTSDVGNFKHQEETKPMVDRQNSMVLVEKRTDETLHQVKTPSNSDETDTNADAREQGHGQYVDIRKKNKKKEAKQATADATVMKKNSKCSFDIKI